MAIIISKDGKFYIESVDGEERSYPSVTTKLKVLSPLQGVSQAILDEQGEIGTIAHANIAMLANGWKITSEKWFTLPQPSRNSIIAYDRFRKQIHLHPEQTELQIIHHDAGYGCTIDMVAKIPDGRVIIDWKTGELHAINVFQLAAYYNAYVTAYPRKKLIGGFLVHLDKVTGRPHPYFLKAGQLEAFYIGFEVIKELNNEMEDANNIIKGEETWKIRV